MSGSIGELATGKTYLGKPLDLLEKLYINNYLQSKGHSMESLHQLPENQARCLMIQASIYASNRLAEVEARARLVKEL